MRRRACESACSSQCQKDEYSDADDQVHYLESRDNLDDKTAKINQKLMQLMRDGEKVRQLCWEVIREVRSC